MKSEPQLVDSNWKALTWGIMWRDAATSVLCSVGSCSERTAGKERTEVGRRLQGIFGLF